MELSFCKIDRRPLKRLNGNRNIPTKPISKLYHYFTCIICFFAASNSLGQYPLAPEVWSIPKEVAIISEYTGRAESPSISFDGNKLYFHGISMTERADTGWQWPVRLNNNVNQHLVRNPCISPNGKRLFFTWFWPGWDLYYSDWDSTTNDWGIAVNCGANVNDPALAEIGCSLPNDTTLIFLRANTAYISYLDSQTEIWGPAERWPTPTLWFQSDWGIYVSPDYKKVYYSLGRPDTTISGEYYFDYDIFVSYKDTSNPMGYKPPEVLNICLYADTQYFAGNYEDRFEGFPTLTPDGKKMYLTTTYDGQITIYESIMLIDENGDPVSVDNDDYEYGIIPKKIGLYPAYPNPFNPSTKIKYTIPEYVIGSRTKQSQLILIKVFDILGNEIATLVNEEKPAGEHETTFDAGKINLASGTYIIVLSTLGTFRSRKVLLIK